MLTKTYNLTSTGSYTAQAIDNTGTYTASSVSDPVIYKKWLRINNAYVSKINTAYVNTFNGELVNSGRDEQYLRPANVSVESNTLSFDPVQGATGYDVYADGNKVGEV